jgi:predicted amidohydrolase YtcJ
MKTAIKELDSKSRASIIFHGGIAITMEEPVESHPLDIAVANGRILEIGPHGSLMHLRAANTKMVDVRGKVVMPGFIDSHSHIILFGQNLSAIDISPARVNSIDDILTRLKIKAATTPPGDWIAAIGYDENFLSENRHPNRFDLDRACPNNPVCLYRRCLHTLVVNSIALKIAKISRDTPNPAASKIGRLENGEPNGVLQERGAMSLVNHPFQKPGVDECVSLLELASQACIREGVTTVCEAGAGYSGNPNETAAFWEAKKFEKFKPRVCLGIYEGTYRILPEDAGLGFSTGYGNEDIWIGPVKFFMDGGIGPKTAAISEPYAGTNNCGEMYENLESLTLRMEKFHNFGFQIAVHAAGDRTMDTVLKAYESILERFPRKHRHRIEHCYLCPPDLNFCKRAKAIDLVVGVQPGFIHYLGDHWIKNLTAKQVSYSMAFRSMQDEGLLLSGGSDRPVSYSGNPFVGISAAVNRKTSGGLPFNEEQKISQGEALKMYTINAAYAINAEKVIGSLCKGKLADIVVLDSNPLDVSPQELENTQVCMTFINGEQL